MSIFFFEFIVWQSPEFKALDFDGSFIGRELVTLGDEETALDSTGTPDQCIQDSTKKLSEHKKIDVLPLPSSSDLFGLERT